MVVMFLSRIVFIYLFYIFFKIKINRKYGYQRNIINLMDAMIISNFAINY